MRKRLFSTLVVVGALVVGCSSTAEVVADTDVLSDTNEQTLEPTTAPEATAVPEATATPEPTVEPVLEPTTASAEPTSTLEPAPPSAAAVVAPAPDWTVVEQFGDPAGGFGLAVPPSYDVIEIYEDLAVQADALGVDEAGRAGLLALQLQRDRGDFAFAAFEFNTGNDTTNNVNVVRYGGAGAPPAEELVGIYAESLAESGGIATRQEVIDGDVIVEGSRMIDGLELYQYTRVVLTGATVFEVTVTNRDLSTAEQARAIIMSFTAG